jgi:hypothetical protein
LAKFPLKKSKKTDFYQRMGDQLMSETNAQQIAALAFMYAPDEIAQANDPIQIAMSIVSGSAAKNESDQTERLQNALFGILGN